MSEKVVKIWAPSDKSSLPYAIRSLLRDAGPDVATAALVAEVANGRFSSLVNVFSQLTPMRETGMQLLLTEPTSDSWTFKYLFEAAGFPPHLFPFLATCIDVAQEIALVDKAGFTAASRDIIIEKTLAAPCVSELNLSNVAIDQLHCFVGTVRKREL
jgi:hypothetical protein